MDTFTSDIITYDSTEIEETVHNNNKKLQLHWSALFHSDFFSFSFWTGKDEFWFMSGFGVFFPVYYKRHTE